MTATHHRLRLEKPGAHTKRTVRNALGLATPKPLSGLCFYLCSRCWLVPKVRLWCVVQGEIALVDTKLVVQAVVGEMFPTYRLGRLIYDKISGASVEVTPGQTIPAVLDETERQLNEMRRLEAQAKVAQEMAIANRIDTAEEVEIEEFYEYGGDGKVGFSADEKSVQLGLSGSARRISKRIYRFNGKLNQITDDSKIDD